jgi:hypothetical protein
MSTIQFTQRDATGRMHPATLALMRAAVAADHATFIVDGRPWHWRIGDDAAQLCADPDRLRSASPDRDRLLTISCGAALHYALTVLSGTGVRTEVVRFPDPINAALLATIRVTGQGPAAPAAIRLHRAIALRRTDAGPLADTQVAPAALHRIVDAVNEQGAHLRILATVEVPTNGTPRPGTYAVLSTEVDGPAGWLAAGEALSAALLTATVDRLSALPINDLTGWPTSESGYLMVALRIGAPGAAPDHHGGDRP